MNEIFSTEQKEIQIELTRLDSKAARAYEGALRALSYTDNPDRFTQAANSIRHIGAIITRLSNLPKEKKGTEKSGFKKKIEQVLIEDSQIVPLPPRKEIENLIKEWTKLHNYFTKISHYEIEIDEIEFHNNFSNLETILLYFLKPTKKTLDELDLILGKKIPSNEDLNKLKELLIHPRYVYHFFSQVSSPEWFIPLKEAGFFSSPPQAYYEQGKPLMLRSWPQVNYLKKISKVQPDEIIHIIKNNAKLNNPRVLGQLVDCLSLIPAEKGKKIVKLIKNWIKNLYSSFLTQKISKLSVKFCKEGEGDVALDLMKNLLEIKGRNPDKIVEIIDPHHDLRVIQGILNEDLPEILKKKPCETLEMLCDILFNQLKREGYNSAQDYDASTVWRSVIEDHPQNSTNIELLNILVDAIRDGFESLGKIKEDTFKKCYSILSKYRFFIFKRLKMHLMRIFPNLLSGEINELFSNKDSYEEPLLCYEFYHLLEQQYKGLPNELRKEIWEWITEGPDLEKFQINYRKKKGTMPSQSIIQSRKENWQLRRLSAIKNDLDEEKRQLWEDLINRHGEPEHLDFGFYVTSSIGPLSPIEKQDLEKLSPSEIINYLKKWEPLERPDGVDKWGLAREFEKIVVDDPSSFIEKIDEIKDLDLIFIYYFFSGLRGSIKSKIQFNWEPLILFCIEIMENKHYQKDISEIELFDGWVGVKRVMGWLLGDGLGVAINLPIEFRNDIWKLIEKLIQDEDPTLDDEKRYLHNFDYNNFAINTVRGIGFDLIGSYAMWCARNLNSPNGDRLVQEVKIELLKVLKPENEPVVSLRAVIGKYLTFLHGMNSQWVKNHLDLFFPNENKLRNHRRVLWEGYIKFSRLFRSTYIDLHSIYADLTEKLVSPKISNSAKEHLAVHLLKAYLNELETLDENSLVHRFFERAPDEIKHHFMWAIGKMLETLEKSNETNDNKQLFIKLVKNLWNWRIERIMQKNGSSKKTRELGLFGFWFIKYQFESSWAIKQILTVLEMSNGDIEFSSEVVNKLESYLGDYPLEVMKSLTLILKGTEKNILIYTASNKIEEFINKLKSKTIIPELKRAINDVVDLMIKNGKIEFKEHFIQ
ncbi:MAG: hypothetical protein ACTSRC_20220 [Candidatus Helarchaeota archaeon]